MNAPLRPRESLGDRIKIAAAKANGGTCRVVGPNGSKAMARDQKIDEAFFKLLKRLRSTSKQDAR